MLDNSETGKPRSDCWLSLPNSKRILSLVAQIY